MSSPYTTKRSGRTRAFQWSGEFTISRESASLTYPSNPSQVAQALTVTDGYASMAGIFAVEFVSAGIDSIHSRNGLTLTIGFDHDTTVHDDGGEIPAGTSSFDGVVTWACAIDAEEWIEVSTDGSSILTDIDHSEANYPRHKLKTIWKTKPTGAFLLTAQSTIGGLAASFQGTIRSSALISLAPMTAARAGFWVIEDNTSYSPPIWPFFVNNPDYKSTASPRASLTGAWKPDDEGTRTSSGSGSFGSSWSASLGGGTASATVQSTYSGLLVNSFEDWDQWRVTAQGGPALELDIDAQILYRTSPHPLGEAHFQLVADVATLLTNGLTEIVRTEVGSGPQRFYNYDYSLTGGTEPFIYARHEIGRTTFSVPADELSILSGGHLDQRVLMRGLATSALSLNLAPSHEFIPGSSWSPVTNSSSTAHPATGNTGWAGYRFFDLRTSGIPSGTLLTLTLIDADGVATVSLSRVGSDGIARFDGCANVGTSVRGVIVDGTETRLLGPNLVVEANVSGLLAGSSLGSLTGFVIEGSVVSVIGDRLTLRTDGRLCVTVPSNLFGGGFAFTSQLTDVVQNLTDATAGLTVLREALTSSLSGGDAFYLGGGGHVFDSGWVSEVEQTLPHTVTACELFEFIDLWPRSGDVWSFGSLDAPTPVRISKTLGAWIEGTVSSRTSRLLAGKGLTAQLDGGSILCQSSTTTTGAYVLNSGLTPAGSNYGDSGGVSVSVDAVPAARYAAAWQNRRLIRVSFLLDDPSISGRRVANGFDELGFYVRANESPDGTVAIHRGGRLASGLAEIGSVALSTAPSLSQHFTANAPLLFATTYAEGVELRAMHDGGATIPQPMATISSATQAFVLSTVDGWIVLAGFRYDAGTDGPGKIICRVKAPGDPDFGAEQAIGSSAAAFSFADSGFSIASAPHATGAWILAATALGDNDVSEWMSTDDGRTWMPLS